MLSKDRQPCGWKIPQGREFPGRNLIRTRMCRHALAFPAGWNVRIHPYQYVSVPIFRYGMIQVLYFLLCTLFFGAPTPTIGDIKYHRQPLFLFSLLKAA